MPIGVKDLVDTKGIRTTYGGSPVYKDYVPTTDGYVVDKKRAPLGSFSAKERSRVGMGSQTFSRVFGATCNPYDLNKTCGGSTGGGAFAVACGRCRSLTAATTPLR